MELNLVSHITIKLLPKMTLEIFGFIDDICRLHELQPIYFNSRRAGSGVVAPASEKEGVCPMILKPMQYIQYRASLIDTDVATVDELIDPVQHQWRTEKIQEIFLATDARAILQIRLRRSVGEDWLAWHYEKTGVYSVRSAYRALLTAKESREAAVNGGVGHSNMQNDDKWERLWKLDVIPRVRVLWSRVLKGILPDYATLTRRHVRVDSIARFVIQLQRLFTMR